MGPRFGPPAVSLLLVWGWSQIVNFAQVGGRRDQCFFAVLPGRVGGLRLGGGNWAALCGVAAALCFFGGVTILWVFGGGVCRPLPLPLPRWQGWRRDRRRCGRGCRLSRGRRLLRVQDDLVRVAEDGVAGGALDRALGQRHVDRADRVELAREVETRAV